MVTVLLAETDADEDVERDDDTVVVGVLVSGTRLVFAQYAGIGARPIYVRPACSRTRSQSAPEKA